MSDKPRAFARLCQQHPHLLQLHSRAQKLTQLDILLRKLLAQEDAWELVSFEEDKDAPILFSRPAASIVN